MSARARLPKLKENSKLIQLKNEINRKTEELLEENELDITDINNLIYAAAAVITETVNQPSKCSKNRRNENFWEIRMERQISNWRKEISILAEMGTGSDNSKLNRKKRKIFQKYKVTNAIEVAQLTDTEVENASKSPKNQKIRKTGNSVHPE
jgi:hypothetical protein